MTLLSDISTLDESSTDLPSIGKEKQALELFTVIGLAVLIFLVQADAITNMITAIIGIPVYKALTALVAGLVLLDQFHSRQRRSLVGSHDLLWCAFLFIAVAFLGTLIAEHKDIAKDTFRRMVSVIILFFMCVVTLRKRWHLEVAIGALIGSMMFSAMFVVLGSVLGISLATSDAAATARWEGVSRSAGASDYNPTTAAAMVVTGTVISLYLFLEEPRFRYFTGMAFALGTISVILSFARSAALAYGIIGLFIAYNYRSHRLFPIGSVVVIMVVIAAIPFVPPAYWERLGTLIGASQDTSLARRLTYNIIGVQVFIENPIFGIGPGNFEEYFVDPRFRHLPGRTWIPRQLHNMYLMALVEYGILGFTVFMSIIVVTMKRLWRLGQDVTGPYHAVSRALFLGFGAYLVCCLFLPGVDYKYTWILPGIGIALLRVAHDNKGDAPISLLDKRFLDPPKVLASDTREG